MRSDPMKLLIEQRTDIIALARINQEIMNFLYESQGQAFNEEQYVVEDIIKRYEKEGTDAT